MSHAGPDGHADVSVRVAWADDTAAIAAVQVRAWRTSYADLLPAELLAGLDPVRLAEAWSAAILRPPDARNRLLVALDRNLVTGFVLTGPAEDPDCDPARDGELSDLTVDPHRRGAGHGSRLMQAGVDTLRADRFSRGLTWVASDDDPLRRFFASAGWAADAAHRTLDLTGDGSVVVKQVRLHTELSE